MLVYTLHSTTRNWWNAKEVQNASRWSDASQSDSSRDLGGVVRLLDTEQTVLADDEEKPLDMELAPGWISPDTWTLGNALWSPAQSERLGPDCFDCRWFLAFF